MEHLIKRRRRDELALEGESEDCEGPLSWTRSKGEKRRGGKKDKINTTTVK